MVQKSFTRLRMFALLACAVLIGAFLTVASVESDPAHADPPPVSRRIDAWSVIGPFNPSGTSGYNDDFLGGEGSVFPYIGGTVGGKTWQYMDDRTWSRNQDDYIDLYTYFMSSRAGSPGGGTEGRVAYAGQYVWVASAKTVTLKFGANDMAKVWINGSQVIAQPTKKQAKRDETSVNVALTAGWNRVLVKVVNDRKLWGFYFNLTNTDGTNLTGAEFTPHDPGPGDALNILTPALPKAYGTQPYVALTVNNPSGTNPADNPDASRFRFTPRGGTAPYSWSASGLPAGMSIDSTEGELHGTPTAYGTFSVSVTMTDALAATTTKTLSLTVEARVTAQWWEKSTVGGLHHRGSMGLTNPTTQASIMAKQGYSWVASTEASNWTVPSASQAAITSASTFRAAVDAEDIRWGHYLCLGDNLRTDLPGITPYTGAPVGYTEAIADAVEKFMMLDPAVPVSVWWFDCLNLYRPTGYDNWEFDGIFSLAKTINPATIIITNNGATNQDYQSGDLDVVSYEGYNDCTGAPSCNHVWQRWPIGPLGNNPKVLPIDSWRYPTDTYLSWQDWAKSIVAMRAEPANFSAMRMVNLDATANPTWLDMHDDLGDWLQPRSAAIHDVYAYPITPASWGYAVQNQTSNHVYLHLQSDGRGKTGWAGGSTLTVGPINYAVTGVKVVPGGASRPFTQTGTSVTIDMSGLALDAVDTILELEN